MSNVDKYRNVFLKSLSIDASKLNDKLKYNDIPEWTHRSYDAYFRLRR